MTDHGLKKCVLIDRARRRHGWMGTSMLVIWVSEVITSVPFNFTVEIPLLTTIPFSLSLIRAPVLTKEEIQAIDDAGAKGPPKFTFSMSTSKITGLTGRKFIARAGSLALLAGAVVLGMRVYFGVGVDIL